MDNRHLDNQDLDSTDASTAFEPPDPEDIEAVAAFYERTGVMPVNSIGLPIDRPIIPSRRPDRVGDFDFTTGRAAASPAAPAAKEAEDPEVERLHQEFLDMLNEELKGL
jgi:hypothetical protein